MKQLESIQGTDIYLLDQFLKGRFLLGEKILDAGCGRGRNMTWLAQNKFDVYGCDMNENAVNEARVLTGLPESKFKVCALENALYLDEEFEHVICNAVLHFAESEEHFINMVKEMYRVLKSQGLLFIRMTSTFGLPNNYVDLGKGRFLLRDGSERFLLTKDLLAKVKKMGLEQVEPVKSVLVEELRSMTTLVMRKK